MFFYPLIMIQDIYTGMMKIVETRTSEAELFQMVCIMATPRYIFAAEMIHYAPAGGGPVGKSTVSMVFPNVQKLW
jgi:hypothetical protein